MYTRKTNWKVAVVMKKITNELRSFSYCSGPSIFVVQMQMLNVIPEHISTTRIP